LVPDGFSTQRTSNPDPKGERFQGEKRELKKQIIQHWRDTENIKNKPKIIPGDQEFKSKVAGLNFI